MCAFQVFLLSQWTFQMNDSSSFKSFLEESEWHVSCIVAQILYSGIILKFHFRIIQFSESLA